MELAGVSSSLDTTAPTILKDNLSWHFPFPGANTTPWQLEGTILGLQRAGFKDLVCVQNKTVVTDAFKGEDLNKYVPLFEKYGIPVKFIPKNPVMKVSGKRSAEKSVRRFITTLVRCATSEW